MPPHVLPFGTAVCKNHPCPAKAAAPRILSHHGKEVAFPKAAALTPMELAALAKRACMVRHRHTRTGTSPQRTKDQKQTSCKTAKAQIGTILESLMQLLP